MEILFIEKLNNNVADINEEDEEDGNLEQIVQEAHMEEIMKENHTLVAVKESHTVKDRTDLQAVEVVLVKENRMHEVVKKSLTREAVREQHTALQKEDREFALALGVFPYSSDKRNSGNVFCDVLT